MSDSINVRVTLDSYDIVHPSEKQTQVYVQIPEVGSASWLLDADFYAVLKDEPWPHVVDSAHEEYERRGVVSDSASAAARQAIVDWLLLSEGADYDARYDAMQAAWEQDQARRHPVARKRLEENERLRARVAELEQPLADAPIAVTLTEKASAAADKLTRLLAPTQALRVEEDCDHPNGYGPNGCAGCGAFTPADDEDGVSSRVARLRSLLAGQRAAVEGEHYTSVHHTYQLGRDLPETGGAQ